MNANGNATMKPIAQLRIHIIRKRSTNPAFAAVITNDMKKDMSNAIQNDVNTIRFLLNVSLDQSFTVSSALWMHFVSTEYALIISDSPTMNIVSV